MALDPRILLAGRGPDLVGAARQGNQLGMAFDERARQRESFPLLQQQRQQALNLGNLQIDAQRQTIEDARRLRAQEAGKLALDTAVGLRNLPVEQRARALTQASQSLLNAGFTEQELLSADLTDQGLNNLIGSLQAFSDNTTLSAAEREFSSLTQGLSEEDAESARRIKLGLDPRAVGSSALTITEQDVAEDVAETESTLSEAREEGKLEAQKAMLPQIRAQIKQAETAAANQGEKLSELNRARAVLPGVQEVVDKLITLSDVATYTVAGRAFDTVVKELGFGATEGSTARAKMESLVDNQILPLLRDTFGAQFTEREGERLRRTMLDINAAPAQKKAILNSFIEQKMRDLETKEAALGGTDEPDFDLEYDPATGTFK